MILIDSNMEVVSTWGVECAKLNTHLDNINDNFQEAVSAIALNTYNAYGPQVVSGSLVNNTTYVTANAGLIASIPQHSEAGNPASAIAGCHLVTLESALIYTASGDKNGYLWLRRDRTSGEVSLIYAESNTADALKVASIVIESGEVTSFRLLNHVSPKYHAISVNLPNFVQNSIEYAVIPVPLDYRFRVLRVSVACSVAPVGGTLTIKAQRKNGTNTTDVTASLDAETLTAFAPSSVVVNGDESTVLDGETLCIACESSNDPVTGQWKGAVAYIVFEDIRD